MGHTVCLVSIGYVLLHSRLDTECNGDATNILSMVFYFLEFDATTDIPSEHVLEDRLKNSFRSLQNKRTHSITAVCSFTPYPQLQCWWLCSERRRPSASERLFGSRLHSALSCSTLWKGKGGRATTCALIQKTPILTCNHIVGKLKTQQNIFLVIPL